MIIGLVLLIGAFNFLETTTTATLIAHGAFDWAGHLLTAAVVAIGLAGKNRLAPLWAFLVGGLLPDLGHIVTLLELAEPIAGSSRNGTHSALVVGVLLGLAAIDRARFGVWIGLGIGAASHLWRDMGTGTVPLLWPWSDRVFSVSFAQYLVGTLIAGVILLAAGSGLNHGRKSER